MFKPHPIEFLQTEFDELAAAIGKKAEEVKFFFTEEVRDGVLGRVLAIVTDEAPQTPIEVPAKTRKKKAVEAPADTVAEEPATAVAEEPATTVAEEPAI